MALIGEMQYLTIGENTYSIPISGGSTVSITRSLTSGTKSATISVDGTSYDLYAPTPNAGTVTSVRVQATSPVQSSTSTAQSSTLNTTISLANGYGDTKNPYGTKTANYVLAGPSSGSAAAPSFRALVAADIPDLSETYLTSHLIGWGAVDVEDSQIKLNIRSSGTDESVTFISKASVNGISGLSIGLDDGSIDGEYLFIPDGNGVSTASQQIISSIPTNISELTNDAGYITSADVPEGASAYTGTISAVGTAASNGTNNGFARGDHVHNITKTTIDSVLGTGSGTVKFYREDGSWATPNYITNTDEKLQVAAVTSGTTYYPIVGTGTTAATRQYDTTGFIYVGTNGTTSAVGSARLTLGNSTASGSVNNKQGALRLYSTSTGWGELIQGAVSSSVSVTHTFPAKSGTVAHTSDIPDVSGFITDAGVTKITTTAGTHSAITNATGAVSFNVPTKTSHLTNDSGFVTSSGVTSVTLTQGTGITISNSGTAITTSGSRTISLTSITKSDTTSTASPSHGGTFTAIDSITYDTYGRVTGVNTKTITLPADSNTDMNVAQLYSEANKDYPLLLSSVADITSKSSRGETYAILSNEIYGNPVTGNLQVTKLNGVTVGTSPKFTDTTYTNISEFTNDAGYVTSSGVTSITLTQGDGISIGSSGTAITTTGTRTIALSTSGVTANSYGPSDNASPSHGGTFSVPYVTVDKYGRITAASTKTITLPADSNTDTKVTQGSSTSTQWRKVLLNYNANDDSEAAVTSVTGQVYASPYVSVKASDGSLHLGGTLTSSKINSLITGGTQTAAVTTSPYKPALWKFDAGITPTNGDVVFIQTPGGGHSYGEYLSLDNGTTYKPITHSGTSKMTTHYGSGSAIMLVYDSDWSTSSMYPLAGGASTTTITGGAWRVINGYLDGNTYTTAYCSTAAATAAKAASMNGYVATANRHVMVTMTAANSAASVITLNINGTGAKPIYINGSASSSSNYTLPAGSYLVFYDGTNYHFRTDGYPTIKHYNDAPTSEVTRYPLTTGVTGVGLSGIINTNTRYFIKKGTTSVVGYNYLGLGNNTASGIDGNSRGYIRLYGPNTGYGEITYQNSTQNSSHTLPPVSGTLLNTGTTSFTQTITSGQAIGTLKLDNTNHTLYAPSVLYCDIWPDDISGSITVSAQNTNYAINLKSITTENGGFTISSNGIKIPVSGYYLVSMSAAFNTLAANSNLMGCGLMDTSSNVVLGPMYNRMNGTYDRVVIEPKVVHLTAGVILKPFVRNNSADGGVCHAVQISFVLLNPA